MPKTLVTLGVGNISQKNNYWIIFFETGLSNTLSPVKYIWNFLFRPERKIGLRQKIFWLNFLKFNFGLPSVVVLFCYRTLFKWIGRLTKLTFYDFRHVHIKSTKNVILSLCKQQYQRFCLPYKCGPIHRTTVNWFSMYLNTICNSMWQEWVKSLISRKKMVQNIINTKLEVPGGYITTCFRAQYTSHTWCRQYK